MLPLSSASSSASADEPARPGRGRAARSPSSRARRAALASRSLRPISRATSSALRDPALVVVEVAEPPADPRAQRERLEAVLGRRPRAATSACSTSSRPRGRSASRMQRDLGERRQREPLETRRRRPRSPRRRRAPSRPPAPAGRRAATRRGRRGSGARASARARPRAASSRRADRFASRASARRPAVSSAAAASRRELRGRRAVELLEQRRRLVEVVRADLEQLVARPARASQSATCWCSSARARLGEPGVGDVADQDVLEAVGALARDRRAALAGDEVALEQVVEHRLERPRPPGSSVRRPRPPRRSGRSPRRAGAASSRCGGSRSMRAAIIAWSVSGIRFAEPCRPRAASASSPRRRAGCPRSSRAATRARDGESSRSASSASSELLALLRRERLELDRGRADAAAAPAGPHVEQLGPREADDQQRRVLDPLGEVLDQLEQRLLGPVDVLEDEDERLRVGELRGPLARRPRDLLLAPLASRPPRARRPRARAGRRPRRRRSRRAASRRPPGPDRRP